MDDAVNGDARAREWLAHYLVPERLEDFRFEAEAMGLAFGIDADALVAEARQVVTARPKRRCRDCAHPRGRKA